MIRALFLALANRLTSLAIGFALAWAAQSMHIVIDPSSEAGLKLLTVGVLTAVFDVSARALGKKHPALKPFLGV